jgi:hypothetical protein
MMKKRDIVLILALLAAVLFLFAAQTVVRRQAGKVSADGMRVRITQNGEVVGEYPLTEERSVSVSGDSGTNLIVIDGESVRMEEADCPDRYCIRQGRISRRPDTIVCLPHRLIVELIQGGSSSPGEGPVSGEDAVPGGDILPGNTPPSVGEEEEIDAVAR